MGKKTNSIRIRDEETPKTGFLVESSKEAGNSFRINGDSTFLNKETKAAQQFHHYQTKFIQPMKYLYQIIHKVMVTKTN